MCIWVTSVGIFTFTDQQASRDFEQDIVEYCYIFKRHTIFIWCDKC